MARKNWENVIFCYKQLFNFETRKVFKKVFGSYSELYLIKICANLWEDASADTELYAKTSLLNPI